MGTDWWNILMLPWIGEISRQHFDVTTSLAEITDGKAVKRPCLVAIRQSWSSHGDRSFNVPVTSLVHNCYIPTTMWLVTSLHPQLNLWRLQKFGPVRIPQATLIPIIRFRFLVDKMKLSRSYSFGNKFLNNLANDYYLFIQTFQQDIMKQGLL